MHQPSTRRRGLLGLLVVLVLLLAACGSDSEGASGSEGTDDPTGGEHAVWREYEFKGKPGDVRRRPRQFAPYHLRLDWLMWFAALSPAYAQGWFVPLVRKLLRNDRDVLRLLRHSPFPDEPPALVRARLYRYRFTTRVERRATGAVWDRTLVGNYLGPVGRDASSAARESLRAAAAPFPALPFYVRAAPVCLPTCGFAWAAYGFSLMEPVLSPTCCAVYNATSM